MSHLFKILVAATLGVALGLMATFFAVERGYGFGAIRAGPWVGWPKSGTREADPYALAVLSRSGETPLGVAEGLAFRARTDSAGAMLEPRCDYEIVGPTPPARYWTLTVSTPEGRTTPNPARRNGFVSSEIVRDMEGGFVIVLARAARPGNWLPLDPDRAFVMTLRLYDTSVSATASALDRAAMPAIRKGACG